MADDLTQQLADALREALNAWSAKLCVMPNIAERKRYDAACTALAEYETALAEAEGRA